MNFFCTEKDYDEWTKEMDISSDNTFKLHVEEAIDVAKELFEFR